MNIKTFNGNFFEIGQQQGKIYKANKTTFDDIKINQTLYKNQLQIYEKYYPALLEEFRGVVESGNFDRKKLIYDFITNEIIYYRDRFRLDKACVVFGYKTKDNLFVGRNYDWLPETEKVFQIYKVINSQKNSFLAVTDMGVASYITSKPGDLFYDPVDIINSKGLFIALTFAYANQWSHGLSCAHMTRLIAENCETTKEAVKIFEKVPLCCPKNFFIADRNGDMIIIEHTSKKFKVLYPKENILIKTNHYIDKELAKTDTVLKWKAASNTFIRYDEITQAINIEKDRFKLESIVNILDRPGNHACQNFTDMKTIWTLALDITNKKYKVYWDIFGKRKAKKLEI